MLLENMATHSLCNLTVARVRSVGLCHKNCEGEDRGATRSRGERAM